MMKLEFTISRFYIGMSSNGRTAAFGAVYSGSNPGVPAELVYVGHKPRSLAVDNLLNNSWVVGTGVTVVGGLILYFFFGIGKEKQSRKINKSPFISAGGARLKIKFKLNPPDCHKTQWHENNSMTPVYYFRFLVKNEGKTQAEECEAILEEMYKKNRAGQFIKEKNFTPVNLKWSGVAGIKQKTIQPGREIFCDLGRIHNPSHNYHSIYQGISENEQSLNKFAFELPDLYFSQWDCLLPGNYKLTVSVYSKNAEKITRQFNISWTGRWEDEESNMFNELVIHLR